MSDRIEGGNAITTITSSADAEPEIATGQPTDREIIAALVNALVKARDFIAEEFQNRQDGLIVPDDPPEYLTRPESVLSDIDAALKLAGA